MAHQKINFLPIWQEIDIMLTYKNNNSNSNYPSFLLQNDFLKNWVAILVYKDFWYQELTRDTTLLCDMTSKMKFYYMTYVFMGQDRAFALDGYVGCGHFFIWQSKGKEVSAPD